MFDPTTFTGFHTWLSLIALACGVLVTLDLTRGAHRPGLIAAFLVTAIATDITGYGFAANAVLPSHIVGAISLGALAVACFAVYGRHRAGPWRNAFGISAIAAAYLLAFVALAQTFGKVPSLGGNGPAFVVAQLVVLIAFVAAGVAAFRARPALAAAL